MHKKIKIVLIRLNSMVLVNTQVGKANLTDIRNLDVYGDIKHCYRIVMKLQQNKNGSL